jgi:hypothetical protein
MRTCRQIYHKSVDYLYTRGRIGVEVEGDSLRVLGQSFKPATEAVPCPESSHMLVASISGSFSDCTLALISEKSASPI